MDGSSRKVDDQLDDLRAKDNWKQALKLIDSRQKKGDKSDLLQVRKVILLLECPDASRRQTGAKEIDALLNRIPPIVDIQALTTLDDFLSKDQGNNKLSDHIWDRAVAAKSQNEEVVGRWFSVNFSKENWTSAQKAAMVWQKSFPENRTPFFLYIICCFLISTSDDSSDKDRKLSQMLSYKFLSKAISETQARKGDEDPPSQSRAIVTEEDLHLLVRVYTAQGRNSETLAILEDPRTGLGSPLVKDSWEVVREMIELYTECKEWKKLWEMCRTILQCVQKGAFEPFEQKPSLDYGVLGDDWSVWNGFVVATFELDQASPPSTPQSYADYFDNLVETYCRNHPSRNARLAIIKLLSLKLDHHPEEDSIPLLAVMCRYFLEFRGKVTCFHDLKPYLEALIFDGDEEFLFHIMEEAERERTSADSSETQKLAWVTTEVNVLKFEYHLVVSRDGIENPSELLPSFVKNALNLYELSLSLDFKLPSSDRLPGDDAAVLAAMALIRMYKMGYNISSFGSSLLRCIVLLEMALSRSKHNYDMLLALVKIYMFLGAGSLAVERYAQLSIKNLQNVTLSWILFTRISTIHPHPVNDSQHGQSNGAFDPLWAMYDILLWQTRAAELNMQSLHKLQQNNSWTMALDALGTKRVLYNGFMRLVLVAECSRIQRLRSPAGDHEFQMALISVPKKLQFTRDTKAFPNYESANQMTFEMALPSADIHSLPNDKWIAANLRQAEIWDRLSDSKSTCINPGQLFRLRDGSQDDANTAADVEEYTYEFSQQIYTTFAIMARAAESGAWKPNTILFVTQGLDKVNILVELLVKCEAHYDVIRQFKEGRVKQLSWEMLTTCYLKLEICQMIKRGNAWVSELQRRPGTPFPPVVKKMLETILKGCQSLATQIWTDATNIRADVEKPEFLDDLCRRVKGQDEISKNLDRLATDDVNVRSICQKLQESWLDAWEGVIKTKIS